MALITKDIQQFRETFERVADALETGRTDQGWIKIQRTPKGGVVVDTSWGHFNRGPAGLVQAKFKEPPAPRGEI